jgi:tetratricopeptide (TPR) repeat protein
MTLARWGKIGRGMTDFRPGDYRSVAAQQRSGGPWVLLGLAVVLLAGLAWAYQYRPQWVARLADLAHLPRGFSPAQDGKPDGEFAVLYQKYGMAPLGAGAAGDYKVNGLLAGLQKEPCDKQAIFQASIALENLRVVRGAADLLKGFADVCPDGSGERYRASELYYLLGDYEMAVKLSSDLIEHQPDVQNPYFIRARSEQGLKRYAAAVEDYATLIRLMPDAKIHRAGGVYAHGGCV